MDILKKYITLFLRIFVGRVDNRIDGPLTEVKPRHFNKDQRELLICICIHLV